MERWKNHTLYGNGGNATLVAEDESTMVIPRGGYHGNALQFDGHGSWAYLDDDLPCFLDPGLCKNLTIAFRIRLNSTQVVNATVYVVSAGGLDGIQGVSVFISNGTLYTSIVTPERTVSGTWPHAISYNTWVHVAIRLRIDQMDAYVDGVNLGVTGPSGAGSVSANTFKIALGKRSDDAGGETAQHAGFLLDELWLKEGDTGTWRMEQFHKGEATDADHCLSGSRTVYPKKYARGFCCALLCCGYALVHNEFTWSIYPYSSELLCWHWGNR